MMSFVVSLLDAIQFTTTSLLQSPIPPTNSNHAHFPFFFCCDRLNMNDYSLNGVVFLDMPSTTRSQVPSFADFKLRGYSGGFASKCVVDYVLIFRCFYDR